MIIRPAKYLEEVVGELKKVTWPNRQQTTNMTLVVVGVSVGVAFYLTGIDFILSKAMDWLLNT